MPDVFRPKRNDERREAERFSRDASPLGCRFTLFTGWLIPVGASTTGTRHLIQCDGSGSGRFNKLDEKKRESARPAT